MPNYTITLAEDTHRVVVEDSVRAGRTPREHLEALLENFLAKRVESYRKEEQERLTTLIARLDRSLQRELTLALNQSTETPVDVAEAVRGAVDAWERGK